MSFGNDLENKLLDYWLKATTFTKAKYVSLHTADPGETGASEVTGGSYARQQVTNVNWDAAVGGVADNAAAITFANMPAATVTHAGVWDAVTAGNFDGGGALTASKVVGSGDTVEFPIGDFDISLD